MVKQIFNTKLINHDRHGTKYNWRKTLLIVEYQLLRKI